MKTSLYREKVIDHLTRYKKEFLGVSEKGVYRNSNKDYGHILPITQSRIPGFNFLPTIRLDKEHVLSTKYHQYAHHLNSSQVMCMNFFLPLIDNPNILLKIIQEVTNINIREESQIKEVAFEKIVSNSDNTNFDFYIELTRGDKIYFEIKYTEQEFGGSCFDKGILREKYESKYKDYYLNYLETSLMETKDKEEFFKDYQINRNLSYIKSSNDYVVFIFPFDSENLYKEVDIALNKNNSIKSQVKILDWKDLCSTSLNLTRNTTLHQHYVLFENKYIDI